MTKETFTMQFTCSQEDKPFTVHFERHSSGAVFTISRIEESTPSTQSHKSIDAEKTANISISTLDLEGFKCPHCDHDASSKNNVYFFECPTCKYNVCGSRTGWWFNRCRKSCGFSTRRPSGSSIFSFKGLLNSSSQPQLTHSGKTGNALIPRD